MVARSTQGIHLRPRRVQGFDPSRIAPGVSAKPHGNGRTLSVILPELAELYGIEHRIRSSQGKGTIVALTFPREVPKAIGVAPMRGDKRVDA